MDIFSVVITRDGTSQTKKFRHPVSTSSSQSVKEKVETECRNTFLVQGGSIVDDEGVDVEVFSPGLSYDFINFQLSGILFYLCFKLISIATCLNYFLLIFIL
jgi:hypothetical protein